MSSLSTFALAATSVFYLAISYYNVFDQAGLLAHLGLEKGYEITQLAVMSMRCFGVASFILAFIIGHMIKMKDKHKSAIRTSLMTTACFAALYLHRLYGEAAPAAAGIAACTKMLYCNGGLAVLNFVAMVTLPKEEVQPKKKN